MATVNVTELRQNLPAYLAQVRKGQRFQVTSRGRVIAELAPPAPTADEVAAARALLRNSVIEYRDPLAPATDEGEWDALR